MSGPAVERTRGSYPTLDEFAQLEFDPESFDHAAHVYVGWALATTYPLDDAIRRFADTLRRLTRSLNVEGKYHETITWFFMILIAERQTATQATTWEEFAAANDDLLNDSKTLLESHYSPARLWSEQARQQFLMPDSVMRDLTQD